MICLICLARNVVEQVERDRETNKKYDKDYAEKDFPLGKDFS